VSGGIGRIACVRELDEGMPGEYNCGTITHFGPTSP